LRLTRLTLTSQQQGYLELLIEVMSKNGSAIIDELYEPPFTLRAPQGPEQLFSEVDGIDMVLKAGPCKCPARDIRIAVVLLDMSASTPRHDDRKSLGSLQLDTPRACTIDSLKPSGLSDQ